MLTWFWLGVSHNFVGIDENVKEFTETVARVFRRFVGKQVVTHEELRIGHECEHTLRRFVHDLLVYKTVYIRCTATTTGDDDVTSSTGSTLLFLRLQ